MNALDVMKALGNVPADMIGACMDDLTAADEPELPEAGTALHDDLPEPVSAVRSVRILRIIPAAAAACLLIGVFAAVYPKLRIQTPEITEPPAATVTTETTAQNTPETTAVTVYTTAVSMKTTRRTTAETVNQTVNETVTDAVTEKANGSGVEAATENHAVSPAVSSDAPESQPPDETIRTMPSQTEPYQHTEDPKPVTTDAELQTAAPMSVTVNSAQLTTDPLQSGLPTVATTETEPVILLDKIRALFQAFITEERLPARIADEAQYPEFTGKIVIEWDPASGIDVERQILRFTKENQIDGYLFVTHRLAPGVIIGNPENSSL